MPYSPPKQLLKGRTVMVTGAGQGIGRAIARAAAEHGATLVLHGRSSERLESLYDEIVAAGCPEPGIAPLDLAALTGDAAAQLHDVLASRYGRLDGLVHNAGVLGERLPFQTANLDEWQRVMQVNLDAVVRLTQTLLPLLELSDQGRLVFTSSGVGTKPRAYWGAYAVSKHAVEGFAQLLADELENTSRIRVNVVNPGATRTAMRAAAYPAEDPSTLKTPEDLAPLYLYLLGKDSEVEHGQRFTSDWLTD